MAKRKFPDRPPGTMAHQRAVGGGTRIHQPKRLPIKVTHPDGEVEWVPAHEYDKRRAATRKGRVALRQQREIRAELIESGMAEPIADALAWARLEGQVDSVVWSEAQRLSIDPTAEHGPIDEREEIEEPGPEPDQPDQEAPLPDVHLVPAAIARLSAPVQEPILLLPPNWPTLAIYAMEGDDSGAYLLTPTGGPGDGD